MLLAMLSMLLLRVTLTYRLKKKLKPTGEYWRTGTLDLDFGNTVLFALVCTLPFAQRSDFYKAVYPDLDIKAFANPFETVLAYSMVTGFAVFFIMGPFYYIFA
ncbi:hypothetical protein [Marinobacter sp. AN1]|uniref:hypothetical protein n=1 Tax=Marinobacter sp. AN1 TaxID=2886046 RepID=UPI00223014D2|nr:hypothetical protein [Marinobacter sp. AN1]UZD64571.1 hypothetical protein LJ360_13210 [Marinobacter sp. AN1]